MPKPPIHLRGIRGIRVVYPRDRVFSPQVVKVEQVHIDHCPLPKDYHCRCRLCRRFLGELIQPSGEYYSRLERRRYYDPIEQGKDGHTAKTPLHIARWAVQEYTREGQWVLDPTAGSGTSLVEALIQGRPAVGVELQFEEMLLANISRFQSGNTPAIIGIGDARDIYPFLRDTCRRKFHLVINNPPYSADEHWSTFNVREEKRARGQWSTQFKRYRRDQPNLAFLKEGKEFWRTLQKIYKDCSRFLVPGGYFVVGVKDQMRQKKPDNLHRKIGTILEAIGLVHNGVALLRHYPGTLHLHTYFKRYGVHPPYYQTILVFRKE